MIADKQEPVRTDSDPPGRGRQEGRKRTLNEWIKSKLYLPPMLRDFHDAKDVFKVIDEISSRYDWGVMGGPSFMQAQCYVIDIFLWYMAKRGWTLQRSRSHPSDGFLSIEDDIKAYHARQV